MTTRVVFLDDYQGAAHALAPLHLLTDAECVVMREHLTGDALVDAMAGAEVVVAMRERTRFDRALFGRLPDLRLLCTTAPLNNAIDLVAAADHGVVVSATEGYASANTAELTWALILALARNLPVEVASVDSGGWQRKVGVDLAGATLGLVGLGRVGARVARVAQAFDMDVAAWSPNLDPAHAASLGVRAVSKASLFADSDFVSIHVVLSDRSRGLVGEDELKSMRPTAFLVNTARGPIVDEQALLRAVEEGWIAGVGIDVFSEEPLPVDHRLRQLPQAILTPHIGYVTVGTLRQWYGDVIENIIAWRAGTPTRTLPPA